MSEIEQYKVNSRVSIYNILKSYRDLGIKCTYHRPFTINLMQLDIGDKFTVKQLKETLEKFNEQDLLYIFDESLCAHEDKVFATDDQYLQYIHKQFVKINEVHIRCISYHWIEDTKTRSEVSQLINNTRDLVQDLKFYIEQDLLVNINMARKLILSNQWLKMYLDLRSVTFVTSDIGIPDEIKDMFS